MEDANNKISGFQLYIITFFLMGSLFVGFGIISMFTLAERDVWVSVLLSFITCIIPLLLFIYYINYEPDKNIFDKNKSLFGKWIGTIVNVIFCAFVFLLILLVLWNSNGLVITMYLTKTPPYFIIGIFVLAAIYANIKGIEAIARTSEIMFFISLIINTIIIISLGTQLNLDYFKPVLTGGFKEEIRHSLNFTSYLITPLIMIAAIPKKNIIKNKRYNRYLAAGVFAGIIKIGITFVLIVGSVSPEIATFYRFPAYYALRKISIGGAINNLENFLALHWFLNTFMLIMMGIYFLNSFTSNLFKTNSKKANYISLLVIGIVAVYFSIHIFGNTVDSIEFAKKQFPVIISLTLLILMFIISIAIFIKKVRKSLKT